MPNRKGTVNIVNSCVTIVNMCKIRRLLLLFKPLNREAKKSHDSIYNLPENFKESLCDLQQYKSKVVSL